MRTQDEIENEIHELQSRIETHEEKIRENTAEIEKTRALNVEFLSGEPDRQRLPASVSTRREAIVKLAVDSDERTEVIERLKEQIEALGLEREAVQGKVLIDDLLHDREEGLNEEKAFDVLVTEMYSSMRKVMDAGEARAKRKMRTPMKLEVVIRRIGSILDIPALAAGEIRLGHERNGAFIDEQIRALFPITSHPAIDFTGLENLLRNLLQADPREGAIWRNRIRAHLPKNRPQKTGRPPEAGFRIERKRYTLDDKTGPIGTTVFPEGRRQSGN